MVTKDISEQYFDFCDSVYENWKLASQSYYISYIKPYVK